MDRDSILQEWIDNPPESKWYSLRQQAEHLCLGRFPTGEPGREMVLVAEEVLQERNHRPGPIGLGAGTITLVNPCFRRIKHRRERTVVDGG